MLRRPITVITAVLMFSGCAAHQSDKADKLSPEQSLSATVTGGREYEAELSRTEGGWSVELTAPESAKGIKLCYLPDGNCTLTLEGRTAVYIREELPQYGVFDLITSAADMCISGKGIETSSGDDGETVRSGTIRGIGFTAHSRDGSFTAIELNGGSSAVFR